MNLHHRSRSWIFLIVVYMFMAASPSIPVHSQDEESSLLGSWSGLVEESRPKNKSFYRSILDAADNQAEAKRACDETFKMFSIQFWLEPKANVIRFDLRNLKGQVYHVGTVSTLKTAKDKLEIDLVYDDKELSREKCIVRLSREGKMAEFELFGVCYVARRAEIVKKPEGIHKMLLGEWKFSAEQSLSRWQKQQIDFVQQIGMTEKSVIERLSQLRIAFDDKIMKLKSPKEELEVALANSIVFKTNNRLRVSFPVQSGDMGYRLLLMSQDDGKSWDLSRPYFPLVSLKKK